MEETEEETEEAEEEASGEERAESREDCAIMNVFESSKSKEVARVKPLGRGSGQAACVYRLGVARHVRTAEKHERGGGSLTPLAEEEEEASGENTLQSWGWKRVAALT